MNRSAATAAETEFHDKMHAAHMYGLWELASQMTKHPEPKAIPYLWKASLIESVRTYVPETVATPRTIAIAVSAERSFRVARPFSAKRITR